MPDIKLAKPLQDLQLAASQAASQNGCYISALQTSYQEECDLANDAYNHLSPVQGNAAKGLKARFVNRLAEALSGHEAFRDRNGNGAIIILIKEDESRKLVDIWIAQPKGNENDRQTTLLSDLEDLLPRIHRSATGKEPTNVTEDSKTFVGDCFQSRMHEDTASLRGVFDDNRARYEGVVSKLFGVEDEFPSQRDHNLGDHLERLYNETCVIPLMEMTRSNYEGIIREADIVLRLVKTKHRLSAILNNTAFSEHLFNSIVFLSRPKRAFDTLIRTASIIPTFHSVKIHKGLPDSRPTEVAPSTPLITPAAPPLAIQERRAGSHRHEAPVTAESSADYPLEAFFKEARQYLPHNERSLGLAQLRPEAKRDTFLLLASILNLKNPVPECPQFHTFGYSTCRTEDEEQRLGGIYKGILTSSNAKIRIFERVWQAVQTNTLASLFDEHGYGTFRQAIPDLFEFLRSGPDNRPSVWELKQFVRAGKSTNAPRTIRLDYGFDRCHNNKEHIRLLKRSYQKTFQVYGPLEIHDACRKGKLLDIVGSACGRLDPKVERTLRGRAPTLGFGQGLAS